MANDVEQSTSALGTILQSFNSQLKSELTWLDNAFGPAERITDRLQSAGSGSWYLISFLGYEYRKNHQNLA